MSSEQNLPVPESNPDGDQNQTSLLDLGDGVAVLFADRPPANFELIPFQLVGQNTANQMLERLGAAATGANFAAQGVNAVISAQGLVRLAPETMRMLNTLNPITSGGWNLGTLVDNGGKFAHSVRWLPAHGAQATSIMSSLGPMAPLMIMQAQLTAISRKVDTNIELTRSVLQAIHQDQWATLLGLHETTMRALNEALAVGVVNDHIFAAVATREADLRKQRHLFAQKVEDHLKHLEGDAKARRDYLKNNANQIIADAHGLVMAEGSWFRSQVLRASHISHDEAHAGENERLLAELVEVTRTDRNEALENLGQLLTSLERHCNLVAELPTKRSLPFGAEKTNHRQTVDMAKALAQKVSEIRNQFHVLPNLPDPPLLVFNKPAPDELLRILRWVLPVDEKLLAFADINFDGMKDRIGLNNAYLGITSRRFFLTSQSALRNDGLIESQFALADIRYVRFREREKQGPVIDVITADENVRFTLDSWAARDEGLMGAKRLANLLGAAMNLPADEVRTDPLLCADNNLAEQKEALPPIH